MTTQWTERYASRTSGMQSSAIREILKITQKPKVISFAGGLPAPEIFPTERILEATERVIKLQGRQALQYGLTEGFPPLRELTIRHMSRYGIHCNLENVLITSGSQQALDLIGKILVDPGDKIVVEEPSYLGALQAWNAYQAEYLTVETDEDGMRIDSLENVLKTGEAKFIYALPNFQNPTGRTLPLDRRIALVELSGKYGVPIIEDDPYGQLRFEGENLPTLVALDAQKQPENADNCFVCGNVIYLSTFSKTLCPGFRVAWMVAPEAVIARLVQAKQGTDLHTSTFAQMVAPEAVIARLVQAKQGTDLHTSTFAQMVAYETARGGFLDQHVREIRRVYQERRDLMLSLFDELMPPGVTWTRPAGGLFLWITLPESLNAADLLPKAIEQSVAFVPGSPFYAHGGGENTLRINFSNAQPEQIQLGVERLARVIRQELSVTAAA